MQGQTGMMGKRKRMHQKLKDKIDDMAPHNQYQPGDVDNTTINVNTSKFKDSMLISRNFNNNRSFEGRSQNYSRRAGDLWKHGSVNLSYSPLSRKARGGTAENVYANNMNKSSLPSVINKNNIRDSYESAVPGLRILDDLRGINNISTMTYDTPNMYTRTRNSVAFHNMSYNQQIRERDSSSLSSFTQIRNHMLRSDIEKFNRSKVDTSI